MSPLSRVLLCLFVLVTGGVSFFQSAQESAAKTIVRSSPDDECTRHVYLQIEIFTNMEDLTEGALETVADVWAKQIDERWNGPTDEAIQQAAKEMGLTDEQLEGYGKWNLLDTPILQKVRDKLDKKAAENLTNATGETGCALVNCCKIFFHTIIQTRKPGDTPREDFYQIEVVEPGFRSYVRRGGSTVEENQNGASGKWAIEGGESAAPHEAGHLMGIGDFYHDEVGEDGKEHSVGEKGHETDLMNEGNAWPKGEHIAKILEIAGKPCNCCKFSEPDNQFMSGLAMDLAFAGEALAGNRCDLLTTAKTNLENKLQDLQAQKISALKKVETANNIKTELDKVDKALENCDKTRPQTGTGDDETAVTTGNDEITITADEGISYAPFSFDSLQCVTFGGGTVPIPLQGLPYSGFPYLPLGPTQGPASTPGVTPGIALDQEGKEIIVPEKQTIDVDEIPWGDWGNQVLIPFNPQDYQENENVTRIEEILEGETVDQVERIETIYDPFGRAVQFQENSQQGGQVERVERTETEYDITGRVTGFEETVQEEGKTEQTERTETVYDENQKPLEFEEQTTIGPGSETVERVAETIETSSDPDLVSRQERTETIYSGTRPTQWNETTQTYQAEGWLIFKAEQDVVQQDGTIGKGPAEKSVLKLGFTPPPTPTPEGTRTAEQTNDSADQEPQFVTTDENGWGKIKIEFEDPFFAEGFESGDTSSWGTGVVTERTETQYDPETNLPTGFKETTTTTRPEGSGTQETDVETTTERAGIQYDQETGLTTGFQDKTEITPNPETSGRPENQTNKYTNPGTYYVTGFTLDATPTKSRLVYLFDLEREAPLEFGPTTKPGTIGEGGILGAGGGFEVDDLNGNGLPDWTEIRPELENEIGLEGLRQGGLLEEGPVKDKKSKNPEQPGPNLSPNGGDKTELPENLKQFESDRVQFGNTVGVTLTYKYWQEDFVLAGLEDYTHQYNRYIKEKVDDPYFNSSGTWGQPYDDQWAIKSVGFTGETGDAWDIAGEDLEPVVIAFIDSGLDWNHADISWDNIWMNEDEIPDNGIDDDKNGYVDDIIGWDFYNNTASPWDQDGHGTFTAGMVIAQKGNGIGIAGINPAAKIMVLKALNDFGHTRASYVSKAIKYAVDNGAKIINLSIGGEHQTYLERLAISYAHQNGVLVIVAAGNESTEIATYGFAPYEEVIAVASSDFEGKRVFFSNLGPEIDIAAPGLDVLSLRARMTDFMRHVTGVKYEAGSAYVGDDRRYFRSSGTSFSVPMVTGIASLIWGKNPDLTAEEVKRILLQTAIDVELPGHDQFTGYGVVNAVAALQADPAFEIVADIAAVTAIQDSAGNFFVKVGGTASANEFDAASIQIGVGEAPREFKEVARLGEEIKNGELAVIPATEFMTSPTWTIRVVVRHKNGKTREEWFVLQLG